MNCPSCRSKRIRRYNRQDNEFYCPACKKGFEVKEFAVPVCFKCGWQIDDYGKAVAMGNGKDKHKGCRRKEEKVTISDSC